MNLVNILFFYIIIILFCVVLNLLFLEYKSLYVKRIIKKRKYWHEFFERAIKTRNYSFSSNEIRKIKYTSWATAFLDEYEYCIKIMPKIKRIIKHNKEHFIKLLSVKRTTEYKAFYSYFISKLNMKKDKDLILNIKFNTFTKTVYSRENALKVLSSYGDVNMFANIFNELSKRNIYHNEKLLKEHIVTFNGNKRTLVNTLMNNFESLQDCYKLALLLSIKELNYVNFKKKIRESFTCESLKGLSNSSYLDLVSIRGE